MVARALVEWSASTRQERLDQQLRGRKDLIGFLETEKTWSASWKQKRLDRHLGGRKDLIGILEAEKTWSASLRQKRFDLHHRGRKDMIGIWEAEERCRRDLIGILEAETRKSIDTHLHGVKMGIYRLSSFCLRDAGQVSSASLFCLPDAGLETIKVRHFCTHVTFRNPKFAGI